MKLALCQLDVGSNKSDNLKSAYKMLEMAAQQGAELAILPEMFCINYVPSDFFAASEVVPGGESFAMLSQSAKELSINIIGGSVPERCGDKIYNTCMCFDSFGNMTGIYRKAHLFDVDFENFRFKESDTLAAGNERPLILNTPVKTGVSICFDIRFPEWSRLMMNENVDLIALPAAFSQKTGPMHWQLLLRARALDNQCFVAGVAPAASRCSYGHSMLCSPNGEVLCDLGEQENLLVLELPMHELTFARKSIPIRQARRIDLY